MTGEQMVSPVGIELQPTDKETSEEPSHDVPDCDSLNKLTTRGGSGSRFARTQCHTVPHGLATPPAPRTGSAGPQNQRQYDARKEGRTRCGRALLARQRSARVCESSPNIHTSGVTPTLSNGAIDDLSFEWAYFLPGSLGRPSQAATERSAIGFRQPSAPFGRFVGPAPRLVEAPEFSHHGLGGLVVLSEGLHVSVVVGGQR